MITKCQRLVESTGFQRLILGTILFAAILVGLETSPGMMEKWGHVFHLLDAGVLGIFILEIIVKMGARGKRWWSYFGDPWNVFDFAIVAVCLLPLGDTQFAAVLRLARILRVLRLVSSLPKLQILVGALLKSLPSMTYVGLLLGLVFYIYAVVGVHTFATTDPLHFGTLGRTMLTLFQMITLEGWVDIMNPLREAGHVFSAPVYFASFILMGTMIMLNLFIGVIMNGMQEAHAEQVEELLRKPGTDGAGTELATELDAVIQQLDATKLRVQALQTRVRKQK
ncbi:MAG: ion transporter [Verrucomicrobiota bacterium]|nr:ion transporter [Verrucomicrobiota bacterium]